MLLFINFFLTKSQNKQKKVSQNFTFSDFYRKMNPAPVIMYGNTYYEKRKIFKK
jgi:hypothetical protein